MRLTRNEEHDRESVLTGPLEVLQSPYAAHVRHLEAEDQEGGREPPGVGVSQISENILAVLKELDGVLNAALFVVTPEGKDVVRIVCGQQDRSVRRAHVGSN